jgi:hypothetical protein
LGEPLRTVGQVAPWCAPLQPLAARFACSFGASAAMRFAEGDAPFLSRFAVRLPAHKSTKSWLINATTLNFNFLPKKSPEIAQNSKIRKKFKFLKTIRKKQKNQPKKYKLIEHLKVFEKSDILILILPLLILSQ